MHSVTVFYFQNRLNHLEVNKFAILINSIFDKHYCGCPHSHPYEKNVLLLFRKKHFVLEITT